MADETHTLSLKAAYAFGAAHGLEREVNAIRDMVIEWDASYTSSLRRGYIVELFEKRGVFDEFKKAHWATGYTPRGQVLVRRFLRIKDQYEAFLAGQAPEPDAEAQGDLAGDPDDVLEFALEAHLRDFLAKNLDRIEPGLRLYEAGGRSGIELTAGSGRIDILAIDAKGKHVVIELKLAQGRNKALGQLLYYMGWVDQNLGNGPCRGFIIAKEITEELAVAVSRVPGVALAAYRMTFAIEPVSGGKKSL